MLRWPPNPAVGPTAGDMARCYSSKFVPRLIPRLFSLVYDFTQVPPSLHLFRRVPSRFHFQRYIAISGNASHRIVESRRKSTGNAGMKKIKRERKKEKKRRMRLGRKIRRGLRRKHTLTTITRVKRSDLENFLEPRTANNARFLSSGRKDDSSNNAGEDVVRGSEMKNLLSRRVAGNIACPADKPSMELQ